VIIIIIIKTSGMMYRMILSKIMLMKNWKKIGNYCQSKRVTFLE